MENGRKYTIIVLIILFLIGCNKSAYQTKTGKTKQNYYNALYLGDKKKTKKYGKKLNKK